MCESCKNGGKPLALVWWRVSTEPQKEISWETQTREAATLADKDGFYVPPEFVIGTDWASLEVWDSPPMERVKGFIRGRNVHALYMYDADRGPSKPAHRLLLRALCEEYGVKMRCCYGEIPDGEMGEVMEFLSAWKKEDSVHRSQRGAKDGLRDRAKIKGLPVNGKAPYGYRFRYQQISSTVRLPEALEPQLPQHAIVAQIYRLALDGMATRGIVRTLAVAGIPAPQGGAVWEHKTVLGILHNPVYAGVYHALRTECRTPEKRRGQTYGKTTSYVLPQNNWHPLGNFLVESPIVSWQVWEELQERLKRNKQDASRNAKHYFMLRGMLFCGTHGRRLVGHASNHAGLYHYSCPAKRRLYPGQSICETPYLNGPKLEAQIWDRIWEFLTDEAVFNAEMARLGGINHEQEEQVQQQLAVLERQLHKLDGMDTELVSMKLRGLLTEEVFARSLALNKAERTYLTDEVERHKGTLRTMQQAKLATASLIALRKSMLKKLESPTPERKRWALECLEAKATLQPDGSLDVSITYHQAPESSDSEIVGNIPRSSPPGCPACHARAGCAR
jgi:hypothetical protein